MSTGFESQLTAMAEVSPAEALQIAIKAYETSKADAERAKVEAREMSEVKIGPDGFEVANLGGLYRLGQIYANSELIPDRFRGKPYDCAIVIQLAQRWRINPFMAFLHVYIVHGRPAVDAQLATALLHSSGKVKGTVQYQQVGEKGKASYGYQAYVTDAHTDQIVYGPIVDWAVVKAERWDEAKKGFPSKWQTIPDLMFHYRSAAWLIRTRYPEVVMGMLTVEEAQEIGPSLEEAGLKLPEEAKPQTQQLEGLAAVSQRLDSQGVVLEQPTAPATVPTAAPSQSAPEGAAELPNMEQQKAAFENVKELIGASTLIREVKTALDQYLALPNVPAQAAAAINKMADEKIGQIQEENRRKREERLAKQAEEAKAAEEEAKAAVEAVVENDGPAAEEAQKATGDGQALPNASDALPWSSETSQGAETPQAKPQGQEPPFEGNQAQQMPGKPVQGGITSAGSAGVSASDEMHASLMRQAKGATSDRTLNMVRTQASQAVSEGRLIPPAYMAILKECDARSIQLQAERGG